MWKLIWREFATRKSRFVATVAAVMLGVAFLAVTLGVKTLLLQAITASTTSTYNADFYVVGALADKADPLDLQARAPVSTQLVPIIDEVEGVSHAAPIYQGEAVLLDSRGEALSIGLDPTLVRGAFPYPPGPTLDTGRLPSGSEEVMLESTTASRAGLKTGQEATLIWGGEVHKLRIVGTARFSAPLGYTTMAFVDSAQAKRWFAPGDTAKMIGVKATPAKGLSVLRDDIQDALGPDAQVLTGAQLRAETTKSVQNRISLANALVQWFVALALLAGGFLIANTFQVLVRSRGRTYGLLRAVGYTPRDLRRLVLGQAVIVGALGSVLGLVLGAVLVLGVRGVLMSRGWVFAAGMPLDFPAATLSGLAGIGMTLAASLVAARRAGRFTPLETLRDSQESDWKPRRGTLVVSAVALGLAVGAAGFAAVGLRSVQSLFEITLLVVACLVFLVALLGLLPWLQLPLLSLVAKLGRGLNLVPAHLAVQNLRRYPRRAAIGAAALVVGVAIASAGGVIADSARASLRDGTVTELRSDLVIAALQPSTSVDQVLKEVRRIKGVASARADLLQSPLLMRLGKNPTHQVQVAGVDPQTLRSDVSVQMRRGKIDSLEQGRALVSVKEAARSGWKVGDAITLSGPRGVYSTTVSGIFESSLLNAEVIIDSGLLRQSADQPEITRKYIFVHLDKSDLSPSQVKTELEKTLRPYHVYRVLDAGELASTLAQTVTQVLWIMYGLLALSIFIALLGIMNTLALSVVERRHTLGLLRVLGMTPAEVGSTVRWEALLLALNGAVIGWLAGLGLGAVWRWALHDQGLAQFSVPWPGQLVLMLVAVVLSLLAAALPARQAALRRPQL